MYVPNIGLAFGTKMLCNSFLWGRDGGYLPDGAGAGAIGQGRGPFIRSLPGGQDEAIDTLSILLPGLEVYISQYTTAM